MRNFFNTMTFKAILMTILSGLFFVPLQMINMTLNERQHRQWQAEEEILNTWGGEQTMTGPLLIIPYSYEDILRESTIVHEGYGYFLPKILNTSVTMESKILTRGIYDIPVYSARIHLDGSFSTLNTEAMQVPLSAYDFSQAFISLQLADAKDLSEQVIIHIDNEEYELFSSALGPEILSDKLSSPISLSQHQFGKMDDMNKELSFNLSFSLRGGKQIEFLPFAENNSITVESDWNSPSFFGTFLPDDRTLGDSGYEATWNINSYGRPFPGQWNSEDLASVNIHGNIYGKSFGVTMFQSLDAYHRTERALKYGLLFIGIPFLAFFLLETLISIRFHPIQYVMVGMANTVFYLLLLSLSEHMLFELSYFLASIATMASITFYTASILKGSGKALILAPILIVLYLFLYIALQSEDYALLIGSVGIFVILSSVMVLTRKIDWYALGEKAREILSNQCSNRAENPSTED